jgi:hypothetical protein
MKLRISITAIVCLMAVGAVSAQRLAEDKSLLRYQRHEISIAIAIDMKGIDFQLESGIHRSKTGGMLNFEYAYSFNSRLALTTGAGFSLYNGKISIDSLSGKYNTVGDRGEFEMNYYLKGGYHETYSAILFTVPLMMKYSIPLGRSDAKYFIAGGLKIGVPVKATASISPGNYTTMGYFAYEDCTYTTPKKYGFGNWRDDDRYESNIRLAVTPVFTFETGFRIPIEYRRGVSVGMYFDYGLRSIQESTSLHPVEYQMIDPGTLVYNSVMNSAAVKKTSLISLGLKIGINLNREL